MMIDVGLSDCGGKLLEKCRSNEAVNGSCLAITLRSGDNQTLKKRDTSLNKTRKEVHLLIFRGW
jgi:hypothetical protein